MKAVIKGALLVVGGYMITMGVTVVASFVTMLLIDPHDCSGYGRAIGGLWGMLAVMFLASVAVVGVVAWKIIPGVVGRLVIVATHGAATLASYVIIAFGLMVIFNC
jgi:hypothetical protein